MASGQGAGHPRPDGKAEEEPVAGAIGDPGAPGENAAAFSPGWGAGNAARRDAGTREPGGHYSGVF
jgi:hypothetical protein